MKGKERIEQQFLQLRDMVADHNRMAVVELQPTEQERNDVLSLLATIKAGIESLPHDSAIAMRRQYESLAKSVSDLKYSSDDDFVLHIPEPTPGSSLKPGLQPALSSVSPEPEARPQPARKTVRFNDLLEQRYTDEPSSDAAASTDADPQSQVQLYNENERLFEDQDRRLDEMSLSVGRQRELGLSINQELDTHNELLDSLEVQTDGSQSRLDRATHGVATFNRKARECGTCSIIMALVLILLIVIII